MRWMSFMPSFGSILCFHRPLSLLLTILTMQDVRYV